MTTPHTLPTANNTTELLEHFFISIIKFEINKITALTSGAGGQTAVCGLSFSPSQIKIELIK